MKFLVTGATGFIGNHVILELLSRGYEVVATSTNQEKASTFSWFEQVKFIPFVLKNEIQTQNLYDFFDKPDTLIHLAWEGLPNYTSDLHILNNLPAHQLFLENLVHHGLKDMTICGTCFEYGMIQGCLVEDMICNPVTVYGKAKLKLLEFIQLLQQSILFNYKWVRLFYVYGKGQNPKSLISQLNEAIQNGDTLFNMSPGDQIRDYLPIEEVALRICKISIQNKVRGIINCCSGKGITVKKLVSLYLKERGSFMKLNLGYYPYVQTEPKYFWGSDIKLNSVLKDG